MSGTTVKTWRVLGRGGWAFGLALGLGAASATSCLGANEDHCLYNGGDLACGGGERCVFAPQGGKADGVGDDGCFAGDGVPDGFVHAEYGLPARLEATDGDPMDVASVEGILRRTSACDDSLTKEALEQRFGEESNPESLVSTVKGFRRTLTSGGGIVKSKHDVAVGTGECDPEMVAMGMEPLCVYNEEIRKGCDEPPDTDTSTSGDTDPVDTTADATATSTGDTSEPECTGSGAGECMDPMRPVCSPMGECVPCAEDMECAAEDPQLPLCEGGQCVECRAGDVAVCTAQDLVCDDPSHTCVPCTEHEQCGTGACELALGTCFPAGTVVVHVDGDGGQDYTSVNAAVNAVPVGEAWVIVVHELNAGASYQGDPRINGGRKVALLAAPDEQPILLGMSNPGLRVEEAGTVAYVDGLGLIGSTSDVGLQVTAATAWVDRSRIVQNAGGGIVAEADAEMNGAVLTLRNSFVGGNGAGLMSSHGLNVNGSEVLVLYTTLARNDELMIDSILCTNGSVTVRNSIVVGRDASSVDCPNIVIENSALDESIGDNVNVGAADLAWFVNGSNDFHLTPAGEAVFADLAEWQLGDPSTDIDGEPRPDAVGPDVAGADVP